MKIRALVLVMTLAVLTAATTTSNATTHQTFRLQLSNFRFCPDATDGCKPIDTAYAPDDTKNGIPLVDQYNPNAVTTVRAGDTVRWTYKDTGGCDAFAPPVPVTCPGHEVRFVNSIGRVGSAPARSNTTHTITLVVPSGYASGTYLPYRCTLNQHYQYGMTGALKIA